jgi:hypothetical protein
MLRRWRGRMKRLRIGHGRAMEGWRVVSGKGVGGGCLVVGGKVVVELMNVFSKRIPFLLRLGIGVWLCVGNYGYTRVSAMNMIYDFMIRTRYFETIIRFTKTGHRSDLLQNGAQRVNT